MSSDGLLGTLRQLACSHVWFTSGENQGGHFPGDGAYLRAECGKCGKETEVIID